ncbi:Transmembrane protein [Plasmodiophora brassicae]
MRPESTCSASEAAAVPSGASSPSSVCAAGQTSEANPPSGAPLLAAHSRDSMLQLPGVPEQPGSTSFGPGQAPGDHVSSVRFVGNDRPGGGAPDSVDTMDDDHLGDAGRSADDSVYIRGLATTTHETSAAMSIDADGSPGYPSGQTQAGIEPGSQGMDVDEAFVSNGVARAPGSSHDTQQLASMWTVSPAGMAMQCNMQAQPPLAVSTGWPLVQASQPFFGGHAWPFTPAVSNADQPRALDDPNAHDDPYVQDMEVDRDQQRAHGMRAEPVPTAQVHDANGIRTGGRRPNINLGGQPASYSPSMRPPGGVTKVRRRSLRRRIQARGLRRRLNALQQLAKKVRVMKVRRRSLRRRIQARGLRRRLNALQQLAKKVMADHHENGELPRLAGNENAGRKQGQGTTQEAGAGQGLGAVLAPGPTIEVLEEPVASRTDHAQDTRAMESDAATEEPTAEDPAPASVGTEVDHDDAGSEHAELNAGATTTTTTTIPTATGEASVVEERDDGDEALHERIHGGEQGRGTLAVSGHAGQVSSADEAPADADEASTSNARKAELDGESAALELEGPRQAPEASSRTGRTMEEQEGPTAAVHEASSLNGRKGDGDGGPPTTDGCTNAERPLEDTAVDKDRIADADQLASSSTMSSDAGGVCDETSRQATEPRQAGQEHKTEPDEERQDDEELVGGMPSALSSSSSDEGGVDDETPRQTTDARRDGQGHSAEPDEEKYDAVKAAGGMPSPQGASSSLEKPVRDGERGTGETKSDDQVPEQLSTPGDDLDQVSGKERLVVAYQAPGDSSVTKQDDGQRDAHRPRASNEAPTAPPKKTDAMQAGPFTNEAMAAVQQQPPAKVNGDGQEPAGLILEAATSLTTGRAPERQATQAQKPSAAEDVPASTEAEAAGAKQEDRSGDDKVEPSPSAAASAVDQGTRAPDPSTTRDREPPPATPSSADGKTIGAPAPGTSSTDGTRSAIEPNPADEEGQRQQDPPPINPNLRPAPATAAGEDDDPKTSETTAPSPWGTLSNPLLSNPPKTIGIIGATALLAQAVRVRGRGRPVRPRPTPPAAPARTIERIVSYRGAAATAAAASGLVLAHQLLSSRRRDAPARFERPDVVRPVDLKGAADRHRLRSAWALFVVIILVVGFASVQVAFRIASARLHRRQVLGRRAHLNDDVIVVDGVV